MVQFSCKQKVLQGQHVLLDYLVVLQRETDSFSTLSRFHVPKQTCIKHRSQTFGQNLGLRWVLGRAARNFYHLQGRCSLETWQDVETAFAFISCIAKCCTLPVRNKLENARNGDSAVLILKCVVGGPLHMHGGNCRIEYTTRRPCKLCLQIWESNPHEELHTTSCTVTN